MGKESTFFRARLGTEREARYIRRYIYDYVLALAFLRSPCSRLFCFDLIGGGKEESEK